MNDDVTAIREALRILRERTSPRLTLDDVADRAGVDRATIHSLENLKREPDLKPKLDTVLRLIRAYGVPLAAFFAPLDAAPEGSGFAPSAPATAGVDPNDVLPALRSEEDRFGVVAQILSAHIARLDQRIAELEAETAAAHHRQAASVDAPAAQQRKDHRKRARRAAQRATARRPPRHK